MKTLLVLLSALLLVSSCSVKAEREDPPASEFDFLSLHWEAKGRTNGVRWCELNSSGEKIAVEPEIVLGIRHFSGARVTYDEAGDAHSVALEVTPEGRRRLKELSSTNIGRRLAIVIDDDVVALPWVWRPIDDDEINLMPMAKASMAQNLAQRISAAIEGVALPTSEGGSARKQ